jgi:TRAP-type C4-dicarboxylate transport system permease small subunit
MTPRLDKALRWLHRLEDALLVALLLTMIVLAVAQIVMRDGFQSGLLWMDSLLRILVLWIALWGAVVGSREQRHVSIDLISRFLPPGLRRYVHVLNAAFVAAVCAALAWYSLNYVRIEHEAPNIAFASVPTWVCEAIMPVSFGLISLRYVLHALRTLLGLEKPPVGGAVL